MIAFYVAVAWAWVWHTVTLVHVARCAGAATLDSGSARGNPGGWRAAGGGGTPFRKCHERVTFAPP
jgi:hypothetical protein